MPSKSRGAPSFELKKLRFDTVWNTGCPTCGAIVTHRCQKKNGDVRYTPHRTRTKAFKEKKS